MRHIKTVISHSPSHEYFRDPLLFWHLSPRTIFPATRFEMSGLCVSSCFCRCYSSGFALAAFVVYAQNIIIGLHHPFRRRRCMSQVSLFHSHHRYIACSFCTRHPFVTMSHETSSHWLVIIQTPAPVIVFLFYSHHRYTACSRLHTRRTPFRICDAPLSQFSSPP